MVRARSCVQTPSRVSGRTPGFPWEQQGALCLRHALCDTSAGTSGGPSSDPPVQLGVISGGSCSPQPRHSCGGRRVLALHSQVPSSHPSCCGASAAWEGLGERCHLSLPSAPHVSAWPLSGAAAPRDTLLSPLHMGGVISQRLSSSSSGLLGKLGFKLGSTGPPWPGHGTRRPARVALLSLGAQAWSAGCPPTEVPPEAFPGLIPPGPGAAAASPAGVCFPGGGGALRPRGAVGPLSGPQLSTRPGPVGWGGQAAYGGPDGLLLRQVCPLAGVLGTGPAWGSLLEFLQSL